MTNLGPAESFKMMNRPDPTRPDPSRPGPARPDRHAFERLITRKLSIIQKKVIRHKMFVNFIKLMFQIFRKILRIVFEL